MLSSASRTNTLLQQVTSDLVSFQRESERRALSWPAICKFWEQKEDLQRTKETFNLISLCGDLTLWKMFSFQSLKVNFKKEQSSRIRAANLIKVIGCFMI